MKEEEIRKQVLEETRNKMGIDDYMLENDIIYNAMVNAIDLTIALMKSEQEKNYISIEEHNKVIDKTKDCIRAEQEKELDELDNKYAI